MEVLLNKFYKIIVAFESIYTNISLYKKYLGSQEWRYCAKSTVYFRARKADKIMRVGNKMMLDNIACYLELENCKSKLLERSYKGES